MSCADGQQCSQGQHGCSEGAWAQDFLASSGGTVGVAEFREAMSIAAKYLERSFLTSDGASVDMNEVMHFLKRKAEERERGQGGVCCAKEPRDDDEPVVARPYGLPIKEGLTKLKQAQWEAIYEFIQSGLWEHELPPQDDPLLATKPAYGAFMLGFDFHIKSDTSTPKLIEVNTNAGGLASVFHASECKQSRRMVMQQFVQALSEEYRFFLASLGEEAAQEFPKEPNVAIVDDDALEQGLYMEMLLFSDSLTKRGIPSIVCSPEDLHVASDTGHLVHAETGRRIHFVYNRLAPDFKLKEANHLHLREALLSGAVCVSPHPAAYARIADKRLLTKLSGQHPCVPRTMQLADRPVEEWQKDKKKWVFKPPEGNASRGVYRGDKVSNKVLQSLPPDTIAQEMCEPGVAEDSSKFDVRVYSHGKKVIALASRHFTGQVMEMRSDKSGFKLALPEGVCCLPMY
eukprot:Rhum_TRINITY_DN12686_c0_g1::Rhum_TRINITY_DN12686_c0_g1_i1::g.53134::m.53134